MTKSVAAMTLEELVLRMTAEPDRITERDVRMPSSELLSEVSKGGGMPLTGFLAIRATVERRTLRKGHRLGPGLPASVIAGWQAQWPRHPLPQDLVDLLGRVNGIHLWANLETGRSYEGLAPLDEWGLASAKLGGTEPSERYLALSYHSDGAAFVVLNVETGAYYLMDAAGPDETCRVGVSVEERLGWLWEHRVG